MRRWVLRPQPEPQLVEEIRGALGVKPVIASLLVSRGYNTPEKADGFLNPSLENLLDPFLFRDMAPAVERVRKAIRKREPIVVYGDYDVDGITGTVLLLQVLGELGAEVSYYIPNRLREGYGLSKSGMDKVKTRGGRLIITVDCGISALSEIELAKRAGIDVIVTDHHQPKEKLPEAIAILNPKLDGEVYPDKELAGVGVAYKLCQALFSSQGLNPILLREHLDLVTLGTVADIVPLTGENRLFAKFGLKELESTKNPGLRALIEVSGLKSTPLNTHHISFVLAPRLNAVGRVSSAREAVRLLTTPDGDEANGLAKLLDAENKKRKELDQQILDEAISLVDQRVNLDEEMGIVLAKEGWHEGVVGIVASRLVEKYNRPAILVALDGKKGKGSGRSISGFHLYEALRSCEEYLISFGGHRQAVGLTIDAPQLEGFTNRFKEITRARLSKKDLIPRLILDRVLPISAIEGSLLEDLKGFAPFGPGNPRPIFLGEELEVVGYPRVVGENHLKFKVRERDKVISAIGFGLGGFQPNIEIAKPVFGVAFSPEEDEYGGKSRIQLRVTGIKDMREEGPVERPRE